MRSTTTHDASMAQEKCKNEKDQPRITRSKRARSDKKTKYTALEQRSRKYHSKQHKK